jgi:hypothetical protein
VGAPRHSLTDATAGAELDLLDELLIERIREREDQRVFVDPYRYDHEPRRERLIQRLDGGLVERHRRQVEEG